MWYILYGISNGIEYMVYSILYSWRCRAVIKEPYMWYILYGTYFRVEGIWYIVYSIWYVLLEVQGS